MDTQKIVNEIQYDIDKGVYDQFETLKKRLQFINNKLALQIHIINSDKPSSKELQTLKENGYI